MLNDANRSRAFLEPSPVPAEAEPVASPRARDAAGRARAISWLSIGFAVSSLLAVAVSWKLDGAGATFYTGVAAVGLWIGAFALNRAGRVDLAAWTLSIGLWASITASSWFTGGIHAPQMGSYAVAVLAAGLLIHRSAAVATGLACAVTILAFAFIDASPTPLVESFHYGAMTRAGLMLAMLGGCLLILFIALGRIEASRAESAAFEAEVEQQNTELELARERYREINEMTSEYFYSMRFENDGALSNELTSANFERITGYRSDELTTELYWEMVHPDDRAALAAREQLPPGRRPAISEHRIISKAGETLWLRDHSKRTRYEDGTTRLYGASRDITQEKLASLERDRLEAELRQSQKMEAVGRLAGGIAHDFNNLLTVITGFSEMLDEEIQDPLARESVDQIRAAADRASQLTRQLMAFSRRPVGDPAELHVNDVITGIEPMLSRLLGEDVEIVTALAPDLECVQAEAALFEQIIVNLAVNARDAMPNGGTLRIETARAPGALGGSHSLEPSGDEPPCVSIRVSDTGVGIEENAARQIFEPFYTTKGVGEGTGLGLSTVYAIVQRFGGSIQLDSKPGGGSRFEILLPGVATLPRADVASALSEGPERAPISPKTVLVVEDEARVRGLVRAALEAQGHRVLLADNGDAALEIATDAALPIDLLVTDVVMPGMDGLELSRALCERDPQLRVLIMSGYTNQPDGSRRELPRDAVFLQKPFGPRDIAAKIAEVYK